MRNRVAVLTKAFRALPAAKRARLLWHAEKGTPICCGEDASFYYNQRRGAG